ncbi:MAG: response regulator [Rhodospirillales bacterium]
MSAISLRRLQFLIIDDNAPMRAIIRNILKELQVESIREAQDGTDALALLKEVSFDMIITDWNMKPMNGLQFVRSIRLSKDTPNRYIPIIMVTAFTELGQVVTARDAGITEFLAKPVSARSLFSRIKAVIENHRQFVRSQNFFGPDRRRRKASSFSGTERRDVVMM